MSDLPLDRALSGLCLSQKLEPLCWRHDIRRRHHFTITLKCRLPMVTIYVPWATETVSLLLALAIEAMAEPSVAYKFALLVDDLSYVRSMGAGKPVVSGYNIFRNGEKIGNTTAAATSYTDSSDKGGKYNVTVVYDNGESMMSNTVEVVPSAIAGAGASMLKVTALKFFPPG